MIETPRVIDKFRLSVYFHPSSGPLILAKNITEIVRHYCDEGVIVCTRKDDCRNFREHCMSLWAVSRAEEKKMRGRFRYKITDWGFAKF